MLDSPTGNHHMMNQPLYTEKIFTERKVFFLDLKENDRGRFLKITEDVRGRRDTIMLPIETLSEFIESLNRIADFDEDNAEDIDDENDGENVNENVNENVEQED